MVSFAAIFYYLLGGVTFLPLCGAAVLVYFVSLAPIDSPSLDAQRREAAAQLRDAEGDDLSVEAKAAALALASNNDQAQQKLQEANLTSRPTSRDKNAIPGAARRLGTQAAPPKVYHSGWLVVRRQFEPTTETNQHAQPANQNDKPPATTSSSRDGVQDGLKPSSAASNTAATTAQAPGQKQGYMSAMYRNIMDYRASRAPKKGHQTPTNGDAASNPGSSMPSREPSPSHLPASKDSYYAIIKGPVLFLYSDDLNGPSTECLAAIDLRGKRVSMYISGGLGDVEGEPDQHGSGASSRNETKTAGDLWTKAKRSVVIKDGELFQKRNAIRIISTATIASSRQSPAEWFVFLRSSTSLEDWYHALVHASLVPLDSSATEVDPIGPVFVPEDMQSLLDSLDTIPDPIPLRWLNAMVGRIFYSIYRTAWIEDYVTRKLMKKIARVKTPGFLSDIRVREVHLGSTPPAFSRPMLKSLTGDGEASMEVAMHYTGAIRLTISTVLTISLGSRFKPYNVPLVLAVVLTSLEGNLLLQIKPPPSNRIWYGFTQLPKMEIEVEPVVSERKVQWAMVKRLIEGRIRELIAESVTVPNMDDLPFFDSSTQQRRGGIWAEAAVRQEQNGQTTASTTATEPIIPPKEDETSEAVSSATPAVSNPAAALRNRKAAQVASSSSFSASMPSISTSSAGAEGKLSDVLARSAKLNGAKATGGASSPERKKSMISSLVGAGHRSTTSLHRSKGPQSSLAWGSASVVGRGGEQAVAVGPISSSAPEAPVPVEREERTTPAAAVEGPALSTSQPTPEAVRVHDFVASPVDIPAIVAASLSHDRSRGSISSVATAATDDSTQTADTDLVNAALEESMRVSDRGSDDGEEQTTQYAKTSTAASPSLPPADSDDLETPHAITQDFETPILDAGAMEETSHPPEGESTAVDPVRKAASTSELETAGSLELAGKSEEVTGSNFMMPPPPPPRRTASPDVASIRTMDSAGSGGEVARPAYAFRPPPQRKVSGVSHRDASSAAYTPRTPSSSSVAADSLHRTISRDCLQSAATSPTTTTTQANILAGWTKAKAAMADKESRQATAGQAKEAASRAWSSWKAKRADTKQQSGFHPFEEPQDPSTYRSGVQQEWDQLAAAAGGRTDRPSRPGAGYQAYQPGYQPPVAPATSRPSSAKDPSPAASSWSLGTGSTDPTSLGAGFGFEMSPRGSPEWQRGWKAGQQAEGSNRPARAGTTSSRGAEEATTASREAHEVSGYREYRAGRSREHSRVSSPGPGVAERDVFGDNDSPLALPPPLATSPSESSSSKSGIRVQSDDSNTLGHFVRSNSSSSVSATTLPPEGSTAGNSGFSFLPPAAKPVAALSGGTTEDLVTTTTTSPQAKAKRLSSSASSPPLSSASVNRSPSSGANAVPPTRIRSQPGQTAMMAIPGMQRKSIGSSAAVVPAAADSAIVDDATEGTDKGPAQSS